MTQRARTATLLFVAAVAFFSIGAVSRGLWHNDEHRYAEVAREMITARDLLVPRLDGEVYVHKPPLFNWVVVLFHGGLGMDLALAAKMPSILGGAAAAMAMYLIGARLYGPRAGLVAAVVLATGVEFDWIARRGQLDALVAGFTTLATWCFVRVAFPEPNERPRRNLMTALGFAFVGLGCLVKGPVAFGIPGSAILAFALLAREGRILMTPRLAWGLLIALALPAAWLLAAVVDLGPEKGSAYAYDLVIGHGVAHALGEVSKREPPWFYLIAFPRGFLPWTLLLPAAFVCARGTRPDAERRADLFAIAWAIAPVVLLSFFPAKRDLYLTPAFAGAALLVGRIAAAPEERLRAAFQVARHASGALSILAGGVLVVVAGAILLHADGAIAGRIAWWSSALDAVGTARVLLAAALGVALAVAGWRVLSAGSRQRALSMILVVAALFDIFMASVLRPLEDPLQSQRAFYERAAPVIGDAPLARYGIDDFAANWVLRRDVVPYFEGPGPAAKFLASSPGPVFLAADRERLERHGIPPGTEIVMEERLPLGHDLVLLAKKR